MSYLVLARRWRPQRFADLIGQDVVVRTLKNSLISGNLAHAYLLCGIRGVGKTTIARLMAMAVNCSNPADGEPCGSCAACCGIADGSNLDVQEMDAASHTGVDDVREILDGVRYPPATLKRKVYIIDEAHMLSKSAFNALLKTLEEPPAHVMFILATTESEKLPVTVRSRCQRFDLRRLGQHEIDDYLKHVFKSDSIRADVDAVAAIAQAADGSVRDALSLAERVLAFNSEQVSAAEVTHALGLVGPSLSRALSEHIFAADAAAAVRCLRSAIAQGYVARTLLESLARLWHQLACLKVDAGLIDIEIDVQHRDWLSAQATRIDAQGLDLRYQVLLNGIRDLSLSDERMGAEMVLMRLCALQSISAVQKSETDIASEDSAASKPESKSVSEMESKTLPAMQGIEEVDSAADRVEPAHTKASDATALTAEADAGGDDLPLAEQAASSGRAFDSWQAAVEAFGAIKPGVSAMLDHVICIDFGETVRLALDKHQQRAIASGDRLAFAEWLGREVLWEARSDERGGESLSEQRATHARMEEARLRKNAEDDPHVQALMSEMDAKLVKVLPAGVAEERR